MRRRLAIIGLAGLGLALVANGPPQAPLPSVDAPPPGWTAKVDDAPGANAGPEVRRVHEALHWRHTGLSERELWMVSEIVVTEAQRNDLDIDLVLAVIQVESGGYNFAVSSVGALGLMQIMPATGEALAAELGMPWHGPQTLFDPRSNVAMGTAYLRQLCDRYGSWEAALAAYNWGPSHIDRRLRRGVALPRKYARQVLDLYASDSPPTRS